MGWFAEVALVTVGAVLEGGALWCDDELQPAANNAAATMITLAVTAFTGT